MVAPDTTNLILSAPFDSVIPMPANSPIALVLLAFMLNAVSAHAVEPFPFFEPVTPPRKVQVMAHRGMHTAAPENTRRAIEMCAQDFFEWVEVDVRLTKDGRHVIFHDDRLDGKTNGAGLVADHTLAELQALDAGSWFAKRFAGEKLLSLGDALKLGKGKINFYLDCKKIDPALLVREVIAAGMERQVIVYAGPEVIAVVREASKNTVAVMTKWSPGMAPPAEFAKQHGLAAVEIDADQINPIASKAFREAGVRVLAKTLGPEWDNPKTWLKVRAAGAVWIQTDQPLEVLTTLFRDRHPKWPVQVAHHRGANRHAPENTLPAIEKSVALRADYVEIDIRTTKDGKFYLLHDRTFDRTTARKGTFAGTTSEEIDRLEAGAWFGKPYAGAKVPTLDEALSAMGEKTNAYLDCKDISPENLARVLRQRKFLDRSAVCQSVEYLSELKKIEPAARGMASFNKIDEFEQIVALKPYAVDAKWSLLSREMIQRCQEAGIKVFSDALGIHETIRDYHQAIDWNIDLIQTDHPARVLRAMELLLAGKR